MGLIGKKILKKGVQKSVHELKVQFVYLILWENRELTSVMRGRLTAPSNSNYLTFFANEFHKENFYCFVKNPKY